jgi:hypothetical protein
MLFTDDGALAAGLSNPTYLGLPDNWQPIPLDLSIVDIEAADTKVAAAELKSEKEAAPATHTRKVYRVCVSGLAWTAADLAWFHGLPLPHPPAKPAGEAVGNTAPETQSEEADEREGSRPSLEDTGGSAARVVPLTSPPPASCKAEGDDDHGGSGEFIGFGALPKVPPTLLCGGGLSAKGWRWHERFGTARKQLESLRHPLEYFGSDAVRRHERFSQTMTASSQLQNK